MKQLISLFLLQAGIFTANAMVLHSPTMPSVTTASPRPKCMALSLPACFKGDGRIISGANRVDTPKFKPVILDLSASGKWHERSGPNLIMIPDNQNVITISPVKKDEVTRIVANTKLTFKKDPTAKD